MFNGIESELRLCERLKTSYLRPVTNTTTGTCFWGLRLNFRANRPGIKRVNQPTDVLLASQQNGTGSGIKWIMFCGIFLPLFVVLPCGWQLTSGSELLRNESGVRVGMAENNNNNDEVSEMFFFAFAWKWACYLWVLCFIIRCSSAACFLVQVSKVFFFLFFFHLSHD